MNEPPNNNPQTSRVPARTRFRKKERLTRKKAIDQLFKEGHTLSLAPLRLWYLPHAIPEKSHQVFFSVPRKRLSQAHDRKRVYRQLRAAYRLQKHRLEGLAKSSFFLLIGFTYTAYAQVSYAVLETQVCKALMHLRKTYEHEEKRP